VLSPLLLTCLAAGCISVRSCNSLQDVEQVERHTVYVSQLPNRNQTMRQLTLGVDLAILGPLEAATLHDPHVRPLGYLAACHRTKPSAVPDQPYLALITCDCTPGNVVGADVMP
jgi:hypothetical protein